jgi:flavin-dependent dehydrogenase
MMASGNHVDTDVLIVGGGPAGSTAGILLARAGIATRILEAERFPRFHVGESLLPHSLPLFDELGVHEAIRRLPHTRTKEGASFVTRDGARRATYWFEEATPPALPHAYQVRRDEFDALLLARARQEGADVREGTSVTAPLWEGRRLDGVAVRDEEGRPDEMRARVVLDATGQSSFLAGRMGWRFSYPRHRKVASVCHVRGCWRPPGREEGNITIAITEGGWFWFIPFAGEVTSVGVVLDVERWRRLGGGGPEGGFAAAVEQTPEAQRRLAGAVPLRPWTAQQNFSYRAMHLAGEGYCMVGDAAGFLDPIFSTGVFLATTTAASAARDIIEAFARHGRVESSDFGPTVYLTRSLHRLFFSFIRAFYNPHFLPFFFAPRPALGLAEALVSLLAADVLGPGRWRRTARFRLLLLLARVQELGDRWGRPLVEPLDATPGTPGR